MRCVWVSLLFCLACVTYTGANNIYRSKRQDYTVVSTAKPGSISRQKCHDFYPKTDRITWTPLVETLPDLPHMAAIGFGDNNSIDWQCAGSLISEKFVLVAAHCWKSPAIGEAKWVRLGARDLTNEKNQATVQDFPILRFIPHPDFKFSTKYNDIGLVELDGKVNISNHISPACLQTEKQLKENGLSSAHWEQEYYGSGSRSLAKINFQYVSNENCNKAYNKIHRLEKGIDDVTQICARSDDRDTTCQGDSGSPLQVFDEDHKVFTIVGVVSFSHSCQLTSPVVASRVSHYIPWIESVVWPDEKQ